MIHFPTTRNSFILTFLSIFIFCGTLFSQTGTLSGEIHDCYTGLPIQGATVNCGIYVATTNATVNFTIISIPVGNYNVTISKAGYISGTYPVTIQNNQVTYLNQCLNPAIAYLTGVITNCVTGDPIVGARIMVNNPPSLSHTPPVAEIIPLPFTPAELSWSLFQ